MLAKHFGTNRYIYNYFLALRKEEYENKNKSRNFYEDCKSLTELKKTLPWMSDVDSQNIEYSLKCIQAAYENFFEKRCGLPKFKSKHDKKSFRTRDRIKVIKNRIYISKFREGIKLAKHTKNKIINGEKVKVTNEIEGKIRFATTSQNKSKQYYVSITVEREIPNLPKLDNEIGIDLGIKDLVVQSNGKRHPNPKTLKKHERKLKILQRRLSKKKKGSNNREKDRLKFAKLHQRIKNIRVNNLYKITTQIIRENQTIYLESLAIKNMMKNHCLAKAIADCSWGEFVRQLKYKSEWYGREVFQIDQWFPSSKTCSCCGHIHKDLKLKDREWTCSCCSEHYDRDVNAAKMILKQGKIERDQALLQQQELKRVDSGINPNEERSSFG